MRTHLRSAARDRASVRDEYKPRAISRSHSAHTRPHSRRVPAHAGRRPLHFSPWIQYGCIFEFAHWAHAVTSQRSGKNPGTVGCCPGHGRRAMERSCSARLAPVGRVRGLGAATSFALGAATSRQRWLPAVDDFLVDDINIQFMHEMLAGPHGKVHGSNGTF